MKIDSNTFKIRCSQIGKIMSGSFGLSEAQNRDLEQLITKAYGEKVLTVIQQKKHDNLLYKRENPELSQTAKSYLDEWIKSKIYSRRKEFTSKYTDKGNIMEDSSLDFIAEQLDLGMLFKNEKQFENEFITGEPDALPTQDEDLLIDAKNSWSWETFPILEDKIPNKDYEFQIQGYLKLTGRTKGKVCYVLSDTPFHLIEKEAYWFAQNNGMDIDDIMEDFIAKMTYPDIPDEYKIKTYSFDYDESVIEELEKRVVACRAYIKEKIKEL